MRPVRPVLFYLPWRLLSGRVALEIENNTIGLCVGETVYVGIHKERVRRSKRVTNAMSKAEVVCL